MTHSFPTRRSSDLCFLREALGQRDPDAGILEPCKAAALDKRPAVRPDIRAPEQRQCPSGLTLAASPAVQVDDVPLRLHVGTVIADNDYVLARHLEFPRSEEHTSELQSLMRHTYAVFCLKTKKRHKYQ